MFIFEVQSFLVTDKKYFYLFNNSKKQLHFNKGNTTCISFAKNV